MEETIARAENKFSKEALKESKLFKDRKDILSAVLKDGEEYTKAEAEELIEKYMTRELI